MKEYKGYLKGFPEEVVKKMLERQVEAGNKEDVTMFEEDRYRSTMQNGFTWIDTVEGIEFWNKVLDGGNWNTFFERYPKETKKEDVRSHNIGSSDYSKHKIQPWDIWLEYDLNPFDADIVKRVLRNKKTDTRKLDYEKIIHVCQERIRQIDNPS